MTHNRTLNKILPKAFSNMPRFKLVTKSFLFVYRNRLTAFSIYKLNIANRIVKTVSHPDIALSSDNGCFYRCRCSKSRAGNCKGSIVKFQNCGDLFINTRWIGRHDGFNFIGSPQ